MCRTPADHKESRAPPTQHDALDRRCGPLLMTDNSEGNRTVTAPHLLTSRTAQSTGPEDGGGR